MLRIENLNAMIENYFPRIDDPTWDRMQRMGFYVTQRGEGKFWILHSPNGKWSKTAKSRGELLSNLDLIFS